MVTLEFEFLTGDGFDAARDDLVLLLRECVHGGASLGFLAPLPDSDAIAYWNGIGNQLRSGGRSLIVAREADRRIVGSGQLAYPSFPNGRHRAEVAKVMVRPSRRRQGIAARIMNALEQRARERAISLLHLDTSEGAGGACEFYETLGYTHCGGIPDWAANPDGTLVKNAIYFKQLK